MSRPILHYYLQDELGSPVRVSGYDSGYLTYGYDEFGNDLYSDLEEAGIPNPYSRQGEEQPFGYTGYRYDGISGTYFAQAREYQPQNGRFTAEDVIKGNGAVPDTLNRYGYCWGNPIKYIDTNGESPITQREANEIIWNYYMKEVNSTYTAIKAKVEKSINSITDTIDNRIQSVKDAGETIKNECNALYKKGTYVWNKYIYGKDTTTVIKPEPIVGPLFYYETVISETDYDEPSIIVNQVTIGDVVSNGFTIGIPKIFNVGGTLGSEGIDLSVFFGVENIVEAHGNLNIGPASIVEIDAKVEAGWNGKMVGGGASFGVSPESDVKAYILSEMLDENGKNTYIEMGAHIKTELVYMLAILKAMPVFELEPVATYILELFGISVAPLGACNL